MRARYSIWLAVLVALLTSSFFTASLAAQDEDYRRGVQLYQAKRYDEAISIFRGVVEEYPDWHFGLYMLGKSYKGKEDYNNAINALTRSVEFSTNNEEKFASYYELADTYYLARNYSKAMEYVNLAKRLSSTNAYYKASEQVRLIEGFSNFDLKRYREAISIFQPLVDSGDASANVLKCVAKSYQELDQNTRAIAIIQRAVQKDPKDVAAHKILVKSYVNEQKWTDAISAAEYAIGHVERDWELFYLKGLAQYRLGRLEPAIESLRQSLVIRPQQKVYKLLGDAYRDNRQYYEATSAYDSAQRGYSNDPSFYTTFAYAWFQYVPRNTEEYHGKPEERTYKQALNNALVLLDRAKTLQGANLAQISAIEDGIRNKIERLDKGQFVEEQYEIFIDPETGEIVKRKVGEGGTKPPS